MNEQTVPVRLELRLDGDAISGSAIYGAGSVRRFTGFIGLVSAIDALIEEAREGRLQLHAEQIPVQSDKGAEHVDH